VTAVTQTLGGWSELPVTFVRRPDNSLSTSSVGTQRRKLSPHGRIRTGTGQTTANSRARGIGVRHPHGRHLAVGMARRCPRRLSATCESRYADTDPGVPCAPRADTEPSRRSSTTDNTIVVNVAATPEVVNILPPQSTGTGDSKVRWSPGLAASGPGNHPRPDRRRARNVLLHPATRRNLLCQISRLQIVRHSSRAGAIAGPIGH